MNRRIWDVLIWAGFWMVLAWLLFSCVKIEHIRIPARPASEVAAK